MKWGPPANGWVAKHLPDLYHWLVRGVTVRCWGLVYNMYESARRNSIQRRRCMFTQTPARWHRLFWCDTCRPHVPQTIRGRKHKESPRVSAAATQMLLCSPSAIFVNDVFVIMRYELQKHVVMGVTEELAPEKAVCQMPATGISCYFCSVGHSGSKIKAWIPKELSVGWSGHGADKKKKSLSLCSLLFVVSNQINKIKLGHFQ